MARRTGLPSLKVVSRTMCRLIYAFTPVIRVVYADRPLLLAALEAANEACDELAKQIDLAVEQGT